MNTTEAMGWAGFQSNPPYLGPFTYEFIYGIDYEDNLHSERDPDEEIDDLEDGSDIFSNYEDNLHSMVDPDEEIDDLEDGIDYEDNLHSDSE